MIDGAVLVGFHDSLPAEEGGVLLRKALRTGIRAVGAHAEAYHVVLEVGQLLVDSAIALLLGRVHVVELVQDDLERFRKGIEADALRLVLAAHTLDTEIRIDQQQGFHRKVLQFEIPGRVICRDVGDKRHVISLQALVGVIIMKIRHPTGLAFLTTKLTNIVTDGGTAHKRQVNLNSHGRELSCHGHGDMMYARDMPQGVKGGNFGTEAHEFHKIVFPAEFTEDAVFLTDAAVLQLVFSGEREIHRRQKTFGLFFDVEHSVKKFHEEAVAFLVFGAGNVRKVLRIEGVLPIFIGKQKPPLFRFR